VSQFVGVATDSSTEPYRLAAESIVGFCVRSGDPGSRSRMLLQLSTNSWAAYNNWGGLSVYGYHGVAGVQGHRASFDRPMGSGYARSHHEFLNVHWESCWRAGLILRGARLFYSWEHDFIVWAERSGYTFDYAVPAFRALPASCTLYICLTVPQRARLVPGQLRSGGRGRRC
jgi:hypothetical protein